MIYSYLEIQQSGPLGTSVSPNLSLGDQGTDGETNSKTTEQLGSLDGRVYIFSEVELDVVGQPVELDFKLEEAMTPELKESLRSQRFVQVRKELLRTCIQDEIGDVHDILADAMKLIEYNLFLTAYLAKDVWGVGGIDDTIRSNFLERVETQLEKFESDDSTFRGSFVDVQKDLSHVLTRYSDMQKLVKERYVDDLRKYGLL